MRSNTNLNSLFQCKNSCHLCCTAGSLIFKKLNVETQAEIRWNWISIRMASIISFKVSSNAKRMIRSMLVWISWLSMVTTEEEQNKKKRRWRKGAEITTSVMRTPFKTRWHISRLLSSKQINVKNDKQNKKTILLTFCKINKDARVSGKQAIMHRWTTTHVLLCISKTSGCFQFLGLTELQFLK